MLNAASATKGWKSAYASEFPLATQLQFCFKESTRVATHSFRLSALWLVLMVVSDKKLQVSV